MPSSLPYYCIRASNTVVPSIADDIEPDKIWAASHVHCYIHV